MKLTFALSMVWTLGICAIAVLAGVGTSWAGTDVPELDTGTAVGGFALLAGAVVLIVERYRSRD
jgi:hypothetical protein